MGDSIMSSLLRRFRVSNFGAKCVIGSVLAQGREYPVDGGLDTLKEVASQRMKWQRAGPGRSRRQGNWEGERSPIMPNIWLEFVMIV